MRKLKVGIVGCGRIAGVYHNAFEKCRDLIEVKYAVDKVPERAAAFMAGCGGESSERLDDLLEQELDLVHICTPHFLHRDQTIKCLEVGFHVLTEKPVALSLDDADLMIVAAQKAGRKLGVILQNRYIDGVVAAKKAIAAGRLGRITGAWSHLTWWRPPSYYECDWKGSWATEGGGVLIDQAIHSIDLVQYLVGSPVAWIHGHIDNRILKMIEVEDVAEAVIGFANGCLYSLYACNYYTHNAPIQIEIMGEKGQVNLKGFEVALTIAGVTEHFKPQPVDNLNLPEQGYWGTNHYQEIRDFYLAVMQDQPVPIDALEAKKALAIVMGIYQSSRENRKITLA
jgi:UDP-N-acetyl-2-amino-2-deoxyglucuronate dehydrogenase